MVVVRTSLSLYPSLQADKQAERALKSSGSRVLRQRSAKFHDNITKRGTVAQNQKKESMPPVGPIVLGFFLFVVVGSGTNTALKTKRSLLISYICSVVASYPCRNLIVKRNRMKGTQKSFRFCLMQQSSIFCSQLLASFLCWCALGGGTLGWGCLGGGSFGCRFGLGGGSFWWGSLSS